MPTIQNLKSIWSNGESWPYGWPIAQEHSLDAATLVGFSWLCEGKEYQIDSIKDCVSLLYPLPDESGFLAMERHHVLQARVLNADGSLRFLLEPSVNMRGFDSERLALIEKLEIEDAKRRGELVDSWQPQALFHYKTERTDCLEIFGDDGFGDCHYRYDPNSGALISAETRSWRS